MSTTIILTVIITLIACAYLWATVVLASRIFFPNIRRFWVERVNNDYSVVKVTLDTLGSIICMVFWFVSIPVSLFVMGRQVRRG